MARHRYDFLRSAKKLDTARDLGGELPPKGERVAFARPRRLARVHYLPHCDVVDLAELEFGDYGRDPRFLPGWWVLPGFLLGLPLMIWIVSLLV